jgi:hypothetical protein
MLAVIRLQAILVVHMIIAPSVHFLDTGVLSTEFWQLQKHSLSRDEGACLEHPSIEHVELGFRN